MVQECNRQRDHATKKYVRIACTVKAILRLKRLWPSELGSICWAAEAGTYLDYNRLALSGTGTGKVTPTDANIALRRQQNRQPYGRGVKHGRQVVGQTEVRVAPAVRHPVILGAQRKEPDVDGQRPETGQQVGAGDGDQHGVGRRSHVASQKHDAHEEVTDNDNQDQHRDKVTVDNIVIWNVIEQKRRLGLVARTRSIDA